MQIFRELAGYSLGRADIVRKAMSKKKHDVLERERKVFIEGQRREDGSWEVEGCLNRGVDRATAEKLFQEIQDFASYAFNKAHAAAYAVVAYQTAYLKCHYPREYMAALLSSVLGWSGKVAEYIEECKRLGLEVLPPHVNYSDTGFTVDGRRIRFGLAAVKNLGRGVIARMVQERRGGGPYTSFYNFCKRMAGKEMNRRAIESLVKCGALDGLGNNRREMLLGLEPVLNGLEEDKRRNLEGQVGFFDSPEDPGRETPLPKAEDFSPEDKLAQEKEVTGMYLTGHPMAEYSAFYASGQYARTVEILESTEAGGGGKYRDGQRVALLGIVTSVRRKDTKSGSTMAFVTLEDMYGSMAGLVFPRVLEEAGNLLFEGSVVEACGRLSFQEEKEPELLCEKILPPPKAGEEGKSARPGLYLRVESRDDPHYRKAMQYAAIFDGGPNDLYIYFKDQDKLLKAPAKYRVEVSDQLLKALLRLLGEGNCRFIGQRGRQNGGRGGALE